MFLRPGAYAPGYVLSALRALLQKTLRRLSVNTALSVPVNGSGVLVERAFAGTPDGALQAAQYVQHLESEWENTAKLFKGQAQ